MNNGCGSSKNGSAHAVRRPAPISATLWASLSSQDVVVAESIANRCWRGSSRRSARGNAQSGFPRPVRRLPPPGQVRGPTSRLQQEDADKGILSETVGQHASGRPGADDDVIRLHLRSLVRSPLHILPQRRRNIGTWLKSSGIWLLRRGSTKRATSSFGCASHLDRLAALAEHQSEAADQSFEPHLTGSSRPRADAALSFPAL